MLVLLSLQPLVHLVLRQLNTTKRQVYFVFTLNFQSCAGLFLLFSRFDLISSPRIVTPTTSSLSIHIFFIYLTHCTFFVPYICLHIFSTSIQFSKRFLTTSSMSCPIVALHFYVFPYHTSYGAPYLPLSFAPYLSS